MCVVYFAGLPSIPSFTHPLSLCPSLLHSLSLPPAAIRCIAQLKNKLGTPFDKSFSAAGFEVFLRQYHVYKVRLSGSETPAVCGMMSSLEEAAAASTDPGCILLVTSINESLADDLSSLKSFVANNQADFCMGDSLSWSDALHLAHAGRHSPGC